MCESNHKQTPKSVNDEKKSDKRPCKDNKPKTGSIDTFDFIII